MHVFISVFCRRLFLTSTVGLYQPTCLHSLMYRHKIYPNLSLEYLIGYDVADNFTNLFIMRQNYIWIGVYAAKFVSEGF